MDDSINDDIGITIVIKADIVYRICSISVDVRKNFDTNVLPTNYMVMGEETAIKRVDRCIPSDLADILIHNIDISFHDLLRGL